MWHPGPEILTVAQHSEIDRLTVLSGARMLDLMENAGRQVANEVAKRWSPRRTTVFCGPGNNGGDGYVTARHLQARGFQVEVVVFGDHGHASVEAKHMAKAWGGGIKHFKPSEPIHAELVVDAIFGAGLSRGLAPDLSQLFEDIFMADVPIVAVDVPSGVHGDKACFLPGTQPWSATLCVTFFRKKPAHVLYPAHKHCGEIVCADIGIGDGMLEALAQLPLVDADSSRRCEEISWPDLPELSAGAHKHQRGHCFVLSGPPTMTGAARLAARSALRAGSGLVTVIGSADAVHILAAHLTSVMVRKLEDANSIADMLKDPRPASFVLGPGAGKSAATKQLVLEVLAAQKPIVLDADALTVFEKSPSELLSKLHDKAVLTPHVGEFERLFPGLLASSSNRVEATRAAAARSNAIILLKGPDTVVADPQGAVGINVNAPPFLATAGSGDVLAGIIGGLLAQAVPAFKAAKFGAFFHGECGRLAGPGLIAEDLAELLPRVMHRDQ